MLAGSGHGLLSCFGAEAKLALFRRVSPYALPLQEKRGQMSSKVFVGGLSWNTNDQGLRTAFEPYGTVTDAKVISDRDTGRSRGFGFVTFADSSQASAAIGKMNGRELDGRTLNVNLAEDRQGGGGGGGRRDGGNRGGGGSRGGGGGARW